MYLNPIGATLPRMSTDAEYQQDLMKFQAEQMALQTKALQAIEKDTHIIQAVLSAFVVLVVLGVVAWIVAVNLSA